MGGLSARRRAGRISRGLRTAAAAFSAFVMASCALNHQQRPAAQDAAPALSSSWERGSCGLSDNSISFSDVDGSSASILLDVEVIGPQKMMCSSGHSVIITKDAAVVSLGAKDLFDGREWLGFLGGRFTFANSYELSLADFPAKGRKERLEGSILTVQAPGRSAWSIDVLDPYAGWSLY